MKNNPLRSVTGAKGVVLLNALERKKRKLVHEASFLSYLNDEQRIVRFSVMNKGGGSLSVRTQKMFDQCLHTDLFRSTSKSKMCGFRFLCRTSLPKQEVYKVLIKNYLRKFFVTLPSGIASHYLVIIDRTEQNITKKTAEYRLLCLTKLTASPG